MHISLHTAKRLTTNHFSHDWDNGGYKKDIVKGETFLQICNGTIGKGRRTVNIGNKYAIEMLEEMLTKLKANAQSMVQVTENINECEFSPDDIPF